MSRKNLEKAIEKYHDIDNYWSDLKKIGVEFKNKDEFENFLFEYACASLEYNKQKKNDENISILISNKLRSLYLWASVAMPKNGIQKIKMSTPEIGIIADIVKYEKRYGTDGLIYSFKINNQNA